MPRPFAHRFPGDRARDAHGRLRGSAAPAAARRAGRRQQPPLRRRATGRWRSSAGSASSLRPGGTFIVVEYDADRGNPWVPHPFGVASWERLAADAGLVDTVEIGRVPSRFLGAIYAAVSRRPERRGRPRRSVTARRPPPQTRSPSRPSHGRPRRIRPRFVRGRTTRGRVCTDRIDQRHHVTPRRCTWTTSTSRSNRRQPPPAATPRRHPGRRPPPHGHHGRDRRPAPRRRWRGSRLGGEPGSVPGPEHDGAVGAVHRPTGRRAPTRAPPRTARTWAATRTAPRVRWLRRLVRVAEHGPVDDARHAPDDAEHGTDAADLAARFAGGQRPPAGPPGLSAEGAGPMRRATAAPSRS